MAQYRYRQVFDKNSFQYVIEVDFQLQSFREYIRITEQTIENEIKDIIKYYDKFLKEASDLDIEYIYDFEEHEIKIYTRQLYYHSLFISLYSFLERKLYQICQLSEKRQSLKVEDISGDGIYKYYKYIKKVLGINLEALNTEWTEITKFNKLRNRIVHFPSQTVNKNENNKALITILQSIENLHIIDKGEFLEFEIIDKELLIRFCQTISKFLHEIYFEKI